MSTLGPTFVIAVVIALFVVWLVVSHWRADRAYRGEIHRLGPRPPASDHGSLPARARTPDWDWPPRKVLYQPRLRNAGTLDDRGLPATFRALSRR